MSDGRDDGDDDRLLADQNPADVRLRMINSVVAAPLTDPDNPNVDRELDAREQTDAELVAGLNSLIRQAEHVDPKQKFLWQRIFKNSVDDRRVASILLMDLYIATVQAAEKHVMHGDLLAKYMERMEKANAQIIKLSEMVQKALDSAPKEQPDKDLVDVDIYDVLEKNPGKTSSLSVQGSSRDSSKKKNGK